MGEWKFFHVSCSNLLRMLLISNSPTSLIMAYKKMENGRFIVIFSLFREIFDFVAALHVNLISKMAEGYC